MIVIKKVYDFLINFIKYKKFLIVYSLFFVISSYVKSGIYSALTINKFDIDFKFTSLFMFTLLSSLLLIGIVYLFSGRKTPLVLLILDILISFLLMCDNSFFQYYSVPLTASLLYQLKAISPSAMDKSVWATFNWTFIFYYIPSIIMFLLYWILNKKTSYKDRLVKPAIRIIASLMIIIASVSLMANKASSMEKRQIYWDRSNVIESIGVINYHIYDIASAIKDATTKNTLNDENRRTLDKYYTKNTQKLPIHFGNGKDKNLVVIQVEALQEFAIDAKFNNKEITPNLNRLKKKGIYFENMIQQTGDGNTSDAEFVFHNSLFPVSRGSVNFIYPNNTYHPFAAALKEKNYKTNAFHAFTSLFWNREYVYPKYGFDNFKGKEDFVMDEVYGWSISDKSFFKQSMETIDKNNKFYNFHITLSSHFPYEYTLNHPFDKGDLQDTMLGNYLQAINYADSAIGKFIQDLKDQGLYKDTVIVIYGDHKALMEEDLESILNLVEDNNTGEIDVQYKKYQKVPCIIMNSGIEPQVLTESCGQIDIMPTLAHIMGVKMPYALGRDVFSIKYGDGFSVQPDGTIFTNDYIRTSSGKLYDRETLELIDDKELSNRIGKHLEQLRMSRIILSNNAFKDYKISP